MRMYRRMHRIASLTVLAEGIKHIMHPKPLSAPKWNYVVLGASALFTLASLGVAFRAFRKQMGTRGFWQTFRESNDPTVFTLVLEDIWPSWP